METREVRLRLFVRDVLQAKTFFVDRLGFEIIRTFPGGMMVDLAGVTLEVFLDTGAAVSDIRVSIEVTDIEELWADWEGSAEVSVALHNTRWGDRAFSLVGPNGIEILFFTPL